MAGMIALGSMGTDWSRSSLRWPVRHASRSRAQERDPVSFNLGKLQFTRRPDAAETGPRGGGRVQRRSVVARRAQAIDGSSGRHAHKTL